MSQIKRLQTIDADTLQSTAYEPVSFVVDDLLPQGLHLLAGAPKIGKSWLALWLAVTVAKGDPIWGMGVKQDTTRSTSAWRTPPSASRTACSRSRRTPLPTSTSLPTATPLARAWRNSSARSSQSIPT